MSNSPRAGLAPAAFGSDEDIVVLDRAADVPAEWDELTGPADCCLSTRWLRVAEDTAGVTMRYLLHRRDGRLDGGLATALATPSSPWLFGRTDSALEFAAGDGLPGAADCLAALVGPHTPARSIAEVTQAMTQDLGPAPATDLLMPSLVCGGRHVDGNRVLTREDGEAGRAVADALLARAEDVAAELGARSIAFLYVEEDDRQLRQALTERGYLSCVSSLQNVLFLPEGGYAAYRAMLPKKRRHSILAERRKLAAAGVDVRMEPLTDELIASMAELESQLFSKHGGSWSPEQSASVLHAVKGELGADAFASAAWLDGQLCGFTLVLRHKDDWVAQRAGFDYERTGDLPVYFEVAYNAMIEAAADSGVRAIHHGMGAERAKRLRGFTTVETFLFVKLVPAR